MSEEPSSQSRGMASPAHQGGGQRWLVLGFALLILAAVAMRIDTLFTLFMADDYAQLAMLEGRYPVQRSPLDLFNLSDGSAEEGRKVVDAGFYPWWSDPEMRLSMLRPLASALIWANYALFGHDPLPYHIHSLFWWVAMLVLISALFRRLLPPAVGLLAFALLVCDEAHGIAVAWLANCCALISAVFSLLGLLAYLRFRGLGADGGADGGQAHRGPHAGQQRHVWLAALWFLLALGGGEYAVCTYGYIVAWELLCVREPMGQRLRATWPLYAPAVIFMLARSVLGVGARKSAVYLDVMGRPLESAWAMAQRFPVMVADLVLSVRGEYWTFGFPWSYSLFTKGWVGVEWLRSAAPWRPVHASIGCLALVLFALLFYAARRSGRYRYLGFLALGSLLALGPVLASFPSSRLLLLPLVGACPVLAAFVVEQFRGRPRGLWSWVSRGLALPVALALLLLHLGWAGYSSWLQQVTVRHTSEAVAAAVLNPRFDEQTLPGKNVLIVAAVEGGTGYYFSLTRGLYDRPIPRRNRTLSLTGARHRITRVAPNAFVLSTLDGMRMVSSAPDQLLHAAPVEFSVGQEAQLSDMKVTVTEVVDALPTSIRIDLEVPVDDPSVMLIYPGSQGYVQLVPPAVGRYMDLPQPVIPFY